MLAGGAGCGCRGVQVMEETGYNASAGANEKDFLTLYLNGQQTTMYIVTDVDEGFAFEPQVRWPWRRFEGWRLLRTYGFWSYVRWLW